MTNIVEKGSNIAVSYTGSLKDGTVFDATSKHGWVPLEFTAWAGQMIAGFDAGVIGMKLGETKTINIIASEAYGEYDENKKQVLPKKELDSFTAAWFKLEKGEKLPTQMWEFEIVDSNEESITIDTNHNLAWKDLIFEVKIEKIK
jgi:FKBP-type peptidyl-prolyl cis-trans isomerase 2